MAQHLFISTEETKAYARGNCREMACISFHEQCLTSVMSNFDYYSRHCHVLSHEAQSHQLRLRTSFPLLSLSFAVLHANLNRIVIERSRHFPRSLELHRSLAMTEILCGLFLLLCPAMLVHHCQQRFLMTYSDLSSRLPTRGCVSIPDVNGASNHYFGVH